jgi:hypothetical protein
MYISESYICGLVSASSSEGPGFQSLGSRLVSKGNFLFGGGNFMTLSLDTVYRMSQEERSIFWEVIVSVILSKQLYTYMCPSPNGFQDRELFHCTVHYTLYRRATRHVLNRVAKCIDVDGGIFENVLY